MRGRIVIITSVVLVCSILLLSLQLFQYFNNYPVLKIDKEIKNIEDNNKKVKDDINKSDEEKSKLANENSEKVAVLEVWENAVNEVDS